MVTSSLPDLMIRRLKARLVIPLSLSLAGVLAPAQGQSPEEPLPFILTQAVGVSFQTGLVKSSAGTLSLGTNAGSLTTTGSLINSGSTLTKSGGTLNLGSSTWTGSGALTISGGTLQVGPDPQISGSTSAVTFIGGTIPDWTYSGATIRLTPAPITPLQPSGLSLANLYNVQPLETTGGLVKTGAGTLQLSGSTGTVTALDRPAIYPLDPSAPTTNLLSGGTLSLFNPAGSVVNAGTLTLTGNSTGSLLTVGGVNQGTSILSGAPLSLATGSTIVPTSGAILTVNGTGNQIVTGSNTMTLNTNTFTGSTLSVTGGTLSAGTLLLRAISDPALTLNGQTVLSGTNILSGGQTLSLAAPVPEPGSAALLLSGALGLAALRRRRRQPERA